MSAALNNQIFDCICSLTRRTGNAPSVLAARSVLLDGFGNSDACRAHGVSSPSVSLTVSAIEAQFALLLSAYGPQVQAGGEAPAITGAMFDAIAKLTRRAPEKPLTRGARMIIVDQMRVTEAHAASGAAPGNLRNAVKAINNAHQLIWSALNHAGESWQGPNLKGSNNA
jgi:hypothetical protein|tara:strand:- start:496 stop:1002 length:507 start_codon:yes stop_codon:yes gene_type:complete